MGITPGLRFLGHLLLDDIGWNRRVVSTTDASPSGFPRSDLMSSVALGRALSTVRRARREKGVPEAPFQRALGFQRLAQVPFWSSWSARLSIGATWDIRSNTCALTVSFTISFPFYPHHEQAFHIALYSLVLERISRIASTCQK